MSGLGLAAAWEAVEREPENADAKQLLALLLRDSDPATALGLRWAAEYGKHPEPPESHGNSWRWNAASPWREAPTFRAPYPLVAEMGGEVGSRWDAYASDLPGAFRLLGEAVLSLRSLTTLAPTTPLEAMLDAASKSDDVALFAAADEVLETRSQPEGYVPRGELLGVLRTCEWDRLGRCSLCRSLLAYGHMVGCKLARCLGVRTFESMCRECWGSGKLSDSGPYPDRHECDACQGTGRQKLVDLDKED